MLDELEWPSLEALRDKSSLLLFHKIHCGAVSIEKDKYMTPAHSLNRVLGNCESSVFLRQLLALYVYMFSYQVVLNLTKWHDPAFLTLRL